MRYLKAPIYELRDALDRLGSVAAINTNGEFISVSDSFTDLFGYAEEEVVGRHIRLLNHGNLMPAFFQQMWTQVGSGNTWLGETPCRHKNGVSIEIRISIAPSIREGVVAGYIVQYQRAHVQRVHNELSDVLYRYRAGFNKLAALAVVSKDGKVQEVNDLFVNLYGYERSDIIGKSISILRSSVTPNEVYERLWPAILSGQVWNEEIENKCKDGRNIFVRVTIAPAARPFNTEDNFGCDAFLVIYQDISREIEWRRNQVESAVESARQQMLAGTLHNIGNLQQSVMAANEIVLHGAQGLAAACAAADAHCKTICEPELRDVFFAGVMQITTQSADQILRAAQTERKTISDTISILHSFRRQQKNIRPVDDASVTAFVQQTLNTFSLQAARHNINVSISAMMEGNVCWPIAQVQQIIFNLLKNAQEAISGQVDVGAMPRHRGSIDISITEDGKDVFILVKDNAGGFDVPAPQLFAHGFTTKVAGIGIGLHNSAIMAQSMGGALAAENIQFGDRRGAMFVLRLPREIANL